MQIVVDASVIIAVISNEPKKDELIQLTSGADVIAPISIHSEIGNAFSAMLKRNRITLIQALLALKRYQNIHIRYVEIDLVASLKIADKLSIYAYDAYLIYVAERYHAPLLTLDKSLYRQAQAYGVKIMEVSL